MKTDKPGEKVANLQGNKMRCAVFLVAVMAISLATADIESFDMVRDQPYNITGEIYIGGKNSLTLTVTLTQSTMSDVIIAIIPSLDTTILAVSKVNTFTPGSAVSMTGSQVPVKGYGVEYINNPKVKYLSRVTFNLGNVTVFGTNTTAVQRQILINFELTMVSARNLTNATTSLASSSISYKNINSLHAVQICQLNYTLRNTFMVGLEYFNPIRLSRLVV